MLRRASIFPLSVLAIRVASAFAPSEMPSGLFHGKFESSEGTSATGQITARSADGSTYFCGYDSRSYFEMGKERVMAAKLMPGDAVVIVADRRPGTRNCYTRTLHVVPPPPPPRRAFAAPVRAKPEIQPMRGDSTYSGIVVRLDSGRLTLRTRDGEEILAVRADTRFLEGGSRTNAASLPVNAHVFVRAGHNLYGDLEAYQVMWGDILNVR